MKKATIIICVLCLVIIQIGCTKRIPISYDRVEQDLLIKVTTKSGSTYEGLVKDKKSSYIEIQADKFSTPLKIAQKNISSIYSRPPVYDEQNKIISEWEISEKQGNKNSFIYTVGGAGLSFGSSFFIGSLIHRAMGDESSARNTVLWTTTGIGTSIGTYLFHKKGKKKDRDIAIDDIREQRLYHAKKEIARQKSKKEQISSEMKELKEERARQEAEKNRLMERLKSRQKKTEGKEDK